MHTLILASTSPYRRQLLERFELEFETVAPEITEGHLDGELPVDRAARLSLVKALAVAERYPDAVVIGSDQVAAAGSRILDKPGTRATERRELRPGGRGVAR